MDNYNYIKEFITNKLEDHPIPSIYDDIKKNCIDKLKTFEDEFTKKCIELKTETINKLTSRELEYQIEPDSYVENNPIVHLKSEALLKDTIKMEILNINQNILQLHQGNNNYIYLNYPDSKQIKLYDGEYIIFIKFQKRLESYPYRECPYMLYISNYGRFIKSDEYKPYVFNITGQCISPGYFQIINGDNSIYYYQQCSNVQHQSANKLSITTYYNPLEYKIPRLFLKIIESYDNQNTDLMQECCKDYFIKFMESKKKDDKIKEKDEEIDKQKDELKEKDEEIERLKREIQELKKFYLNN